MISFRVYGETNITILYLLFIINIVDYEFVKVQLTNKKIDQKT